MSLAHRAFVLAVLLAGCGQPASSPPPAQTPATQAVNEEAEAAEIAAALAKLPPPYNGADFDKGRTIFRQKCSSCHLIQAGAGHSVGPNLHGVMGRAAGALKDFDYSDSVKKSGIVWDSATLDKWLAQPQSFIPNTRMSFIGIKKPDERRDVIAYVEVQQAR